VSGPAPALQITRTADGARLTRDGRALSLRTATEHYGALLNREFDYAAYLPMLAGSGSNLSRTFVLFRELQSAINPYSTCKPESTAYVAPYARVDHRWGDRTALDGQPLFDLDRWDPEFFERLHDFLERAEALDVVVELTLFSNTYADGIWELNPLHSSNNVNGLTPAHWSEHITGRYEDRLSRHLALVDKIVEECREHPLVIFEPCNEPGAGAPSPDGVDVVTQAEVDSWLGEIIGAIRRGDEGRHLVAGQQAFRYEPWDQPLDLSVTDLDLDVVNVHPLPGTTLGGRTYELGRFMSGDLALPELRDFCAAAASQPKPVNLDEDNTASQFTDHFGWTVHRKRAWVAVLSGCHYDMIDFTVRPGLPLGSPAAADDLRVWTEFLGVACERWSIAEGSPTDAVSLVDPGSVVLVARAVSGSDGPDAGYLVYLADATEGSLAHPADQPASCTLALPDQTTVVRAWEPATGTPVPVPGPDADGRWSLTLRDDLLLEVC
jgi:cellulase (glycosyl hydrolase family 5)